MSEQVKIACRNVWKVFGSDPAGFMRKHHNKPHPDELVEQGYIGAVQDVSFDVSAGEILIIMGLSGSENQHLFAALPASTTQQVVK